MQSKSTPGHSARRVTIGLWIIQALLALLFLFAGGMKLVLPLDLLTAQVPLPGLLVRCIGIIEVLGAIGLILPALLRIRPRLTVLAAALLAIEMVVATVFSLVNFGLAAAVLPLVVMVLAACVAYGRRRPAPRPQKSHAREFQTAS